MEVTVEQTETSADKPAPAESSRGAQRRGTKRSPARKAAPRKPPARRRKTSARKRSRARGNGFAALLNDMAKKAAAAGRSLKTLSGQGAQSARRALAGAGETSRKTIAKLTKEWESMDAKRRAQFVAALLAALAAASAPIVRGRLKK
jgi:hypothetical protein